MIEYPASKSLKPVVCTAVLTLDELGAVVTALLHYYQTASSLVPDAAWSLIQRLSQQHAEAVQSQAEMLLYELGRTS